MSEPKAGYAEPGPATARAIICRGTTTITIAPEGPAATVEAAIEALIESLSGILRQFQAGREGAERARQPTQPTPRLIGDQRLRDGRA